ncbi:MAG: UDP-N-acetylmuramate--L-alanine ligase [Erysipelotrichaceae bacterium]|nr:UDP-N-acetylmuramate--L-alanine ligase [Erysipelotrichaceae bacterium]MDY6034943.1 UDP-N-acetylmuramate--L-alanine ligase [Bulleidia sp.]
MSVRYKLDFNHPIHMFFIGIGGISMSGLAKVLADRGFVISGSDMQESELTKMLQQHGVTVHYGGQKKENITKDIDVVVYTAAIHPDNPEFVAAKEYNIPMMTRAELLGELMENYRDSIAISGTHGKTTTTSMMSHILLSASTDPTISIGGMLPVIGGNIRVGKGETFLAEACEYTNSFLEMKPLVGVVLNIEADHLDFFKDINDIRVSFAKFVAGIKPHGTLVIHQNIKDLSEITDGFDGKVITFGDQGNVHARNVVFDALGNPGFDVFYDDDKLGDVQLNVPGMHNVDNALAAIATAYSLGIDFTYIKQGLVSYSGVGRRFEYKGKCNGATVIDDYAHHPQEISATLNAAKHYPHKKLYVAFQPHTYSRTISLLDDFAKALQDVDVLLLAKIYAAREENTTGITSAKIIEKIDNPNVEAHYMDTFDEIEDYLRSHLQEGDLCITMGAGNITELGARLVK